MSFIVGDYAISHDVPGWSESCFTKREYSGVLCEDCDGFMYAECERHSCFSDEIRRFQRRAVDRNATVLVVNGESFGYHRCELPVIFTHHALHKSYGSDAYFELDTETFVFWKMLYQLHSVAMLFVSCAVMAVVLMRCRQTFVGVRRYANVVTTEPTEVVVGCSYEEVRNETTETCAICLTNMDVGDIVAKLPCGHVYKKECISTWLSSEPRCPLCNAQTT